MLKESFLGSFFIVEYFGTKTYIVIASTCNAVITKVDANHLRRGAHYVSVNPSRAQMWHDVVNLFTFQYVIPRLAEQGDGNL